MTEPNSRRPGGEPAPDLSNDLNALREAAARDLAPLSQHVTTIRSRRPGVAPARRIRFMSPIEITKRRPWFAAAVAAVVLVVGLTVIPISYERTTGTRVTLTLAGMSDAQLAALAGQLKAQLHADHVAATTSSGSEYQLEAFVPAAAGIDAALIAQAFAKNLSDRGYHASAVTAPVRERVSGSVYAYAKDLVIRVSTDGKTAAQIEAEVRQKLADAGITDAQVSVTDEAGGRKVQLSVKRTADGKPAESESNLSLELTKDGKPASGPQIRVEVRKTRGADGLTTHLNVTQDAKSASIDLPHSDTMTDAALAAAIESRLKAAGIQATVTVHGGEIQVEAKH